MDIVALHQLLHQLARHRAFVPFGVDQLGGGGALTGSANQLVVGARAGRLGKCSNRGGGNGPLCSGSVHESLSPFWFPRIVAI